MSLSKSSLLVSTTIGCAIGCLVASAAFAHDTRISDEEAWQGHAEPSKGLVEWLETFLLNPVQASARISIDGDYRVILSDGKPDHATGQFPNRNNPHRISSRSKTYRVAANPEYKTDTYPLGLWPFGVAINGIPFDPGAAEFWQRNRNSGWQYEAMGGAVNLGLDRNNAHVQPDGSYHYHGLPLGLLDQFAAIQGPALIGYAADGFPIYGPMGYSDARNLDSALVNLKSSYRIKSGTRQGGPGGKHTGAFVQDYEYVKGLGDLDDCNGRFGVTPDYPNGTYHYVITQKFPFIPRCFHGEPDRSFMRSGPGASQGMPSRSPSSLTGQSGQRMGPPGQGFSPSHGGRRQPPQEAYTACEGKSEGESITFVTPRGDQMRAVCRRPHGDRLFAVPERR